LVFSFVVTLLLGAGVLASISADEPKPSKPKDGTAKSGEAAQWHWPKVVVSKETTYFTGPLRKDGGVDYVAALNRRCSKGVTPENNAAVALWQAVGPKGIDKKIRKRYFEMLGIPEPPESGQYLTWYEDFPEYKEAAKKPNGDEAFHRKVWELYDEAVKVPWSRKDYPLWARMLERNEKPLQVLVDGLQRPRLYSPLIADDMGLLAGSNPLVATSEARQAARLLRVRPMLRLGEGDVSGGWKDIVALYRLGRLESQRPFITEWLAGVIFDGMASGAAVVLGQYDGLTAAQAKRCQRELQNLPPMRSLADVCGVEERCNYLQMVMFSTISPEDYFFEFFGPVEQYEEYTHSERAVGAPERKARVEAFKKLVASGNIDLSEALRQYNAFYDQFVDAYRCPSSLKAAAALGALESKARRHARNIADSVLSTKLSALKSMDPKVKAQQVTALAIQFAGLHTMMGLLEIEQRREAHQRLAIVAFALAGYRADHHEYPKTLAAMVPTYIDAIPPDSFTDGDLRYKPEKNGYLLYSVGQNGKDDGGVGPNTFTDSTTDEQRKSCDDLGIRTPRKKTEQKP
jgi:hypothetical protein